MNNNRKCSMALRDGLYRAPMLQLKPDDGPVEWRTEDHTEFMIWFPPDRCPLVEDSPLNSTKGEVTARVRPDAEKGHYEYSIHCYGNMRLAKGNSPPTMIIV